MISLHERSNHARVHQRERAGNLVIPSNAMAFVNFTIPKCSRLLRSEVMAFDGHFLFGVYRTLFPMRVYTYRRYVCSLRLPRSHGRIVFSPRRRASSFSAATRPAKRNRRRRRRRRDRLRGRAKEERVESLAQYPKVVFIVRNPLLCRRRRRVVVRAFDGVALAFFLSLSLGLSAHAITLSFVTGVRQK